jgi:predicted transcriptional regulator
VCDDLHIPVETGLERLRAAGFEAKAASTIREIAVEKGKPPFEVAKIIGEPSPR